MAFILIEHNNLWPSTLVVTLETITLQFRLSPLDFYNQADLTHVDAAVLGLAEIIIMMKMAMLMKKSSLSLLRSVFQVDLRYETERHNSLIVN